MSRIEQINELLKSELAILISQEIPMDNGLITISFVDCSPDLRYAKIGVSVIPDKFTGTALKQLRKHSSSFAGYLKKNTRLRKVPKFNWIFDETEKEAAKIESILEEIKKEEV